MPIAYFGGRMKKAPPAVEGARLVDAEEAGMVF
jgi:hypothetical protein